MAVSLPIVGGMLSGWTMVLADALARSGWPYFSIWGHLLGAIGMYTAVGVLLGLLVAALVGIEMLLEARLGWSPRSARWLQPAFYGVVGGVASISTAIWTFSGEHVQKTHLAVWGPAFFCFAMGCAAACGSRALTVALRTAASSKRTWLIWMALFLGLGALIARIDLTMYVALYSRVHTIIELIAALCFGAGYSVLLAAAARSARGQRVAKAMAGAAFLWLASAVVLPSLRTWFDESLKHVWLEEAYVGRMLRRIQVAEAFLANPLEWKGMHMARIERLRARYALKDLSLSPVWREPLVEPPARFDALSRLRGGQSRYNVIVYYVDTLRADVAADPETMPGLSRFRKRALDFQRAYAAGSDTLRSLPAMTGGNYDVLETQENDVLRVAKRADYETSLVIAKSAFEFLGKLRPEFYFDSNLIVEDYPAEQQVWGYGAQRPTAPALVERSLQFVDQKRERPFFLWLFNFDQHNWRELDADYVEGKAKLYGIADNPEKQPYRYRAVARAIDHEFERLIEGLEQRHLLDQTIVLFVSDHGEALGRDGFWVHSVFLWECLIRVPLVIYVPKLGGRVIDNKVSLVDVAPTLGRYLDPNLDGAGFHGEDLLGNLLPTPGRRRFPLLLVSASKDLLVRVGLVDPVDEYKLVLSFEAALPELYHLRAEDPDGRNFASQDVARVRRGLNLLVRSPIFPRTPDDFDVRDTRAQKAVAPPSEDP